MKKVLLGSKIAVLCFILFLHSCAPDDATDPNNPGNTVNLKFEGEWTVQENSKEYGKSTYNTIIKNDATVSDRMYFSNLYQTFTNVSATKSGSSFTIPKQTLKGLQVWGSGSLSGSTLINMTYYVASTTTKVDTVKSILSK